jgi:hypothetical protein
MTSEPINTIPEIAVAAIDPLLEKQVTILEELFSLGYAKSSEYKVYGDAKGTEIVVQFRTLTTCELRDIAETLGMYKSIPAQVWTEKIETLARVIVHINKMPLILDQNDRKEYEDKQKRTPSALEQARIILYDKLKSPYIIDLLFEKYQEFMETVTKSFEDVKKKLKNLPLSS